MNPASPRTIPIFSWIGHLLEALIVIIAIVVSFHVFVKPLEAQLYGFINSSRAASIDAQDLYLRASNLKERGDYAGSVALLNYAMELSGSPAASMYGLRAESQLELGNLSAAQQDFRQAAAVQPNQIQWYEQLCEISIRLGNYPQAEQDCSQGLQLNPANFALLNSRCFVRAHNNDFMGASEDCTRAISINPGHAYPYNNRARANLGLGNYAQAITDATRSMELGNPYAHLTYTNRGMAYLALGLSEQAQQDFEAALRVKEDYAGAHLGMGQLLDRHQLPEAALSHYCRYLVLDPTPDSGIQQRAQELGGCSNQL